MAIEADLGTYLETVPLAGGRVHAMKLPQDPTLPALVFIRVSTMPTYSHSGFSNFTEARFQISCWAATYMAARQLAAQVRTALDGYSGAMGTTQIGHCLCASDRDIYEPEPQRFHAPLDYMIGYKD
jgi:hypothetical protein